MKASSIFVTLLVTVISCGPQPPTTDGGDAETRCQGQAVACAQLGGGSCDGQDGCFSGGVIGSCNGSVTPCAELTDDDACLAQEGCALSE